MAKTPGNLLSAISVTKNAEPVERVIDNARALVRADLLQDREERFEYLVCAGAVVFRIAEPVERVIDNARALVRADLLQDREERCEYMVCAGAVVFQIA